MAKILGVDDTEHFHTVLTTLVTAAGYEYVRATCAYRAMNILDYDEVRVAGIITDVDMPSGNGIELLRMLHQTARKIPTYVHSSEGTFAFDGRIIALAEEIPRLWPHASFMRKDGNMVKNVTAFLESLPR